MSGYSELSRDELETRLRLTEDVCVMYGWSPAQMDTDCDPVDAATELWQRWYAHVGPEYLRSDAQPELAGAEHSLAERRRSTRDAALRAIRGMSA